MQQLSAERFLVNNLHDVLLKERDQGCKVDADDLKAVLSKSVSHQDNEVVINKILFKPNLTK